MGGDRSKPPPLSEVDEAKAGLLAMQVRDWEVNTYRGPWVTETKNTFLEAAIKRLEEKNCAEEYDWEVVLSCLHNRIKTQSRNIREAQDWDIGIREFFNSRRRNLPYTAAAKTLFYLLVTYYSAKRPVSQVYSPDVVIHAILLNAVPNDLVSCSSKTRAVHRSLTSLCLAMPV